MCGRTSLFVPQDELETRFDARIVADGGYIPRYNIAPGEPLEVLTNEAPEDIDRFHWGLIPQWADAPGEGLINARSETVDEKRPFRDAWTNRPCLVLTSGFYEWRTTQTGPNRPFRIYRAGDQAFALAGLWEVWNQEGRTVPSVTILTTKPNEVVAPIHDRMPVVLPRDAEETWLTGDPADRATLCHPYRGGDLEAYEVSTRVNDPGNDDPAILEPVDHEQKGLDEFGRR